MDSNLHYYDEILEFHPDTEEWSLAGHMRLDTSILSPPSTLKTSEMFALSERS